MFRIVLEQDITLQILNDIFIPFVHLIKAFRLEQVIEDRSQNKQLSLNDYSEGTTVTVRTKLWGLLMIL